MMKRSVNADGEAARLESDESESLGFDPSALREWNVNADGEAARSEAGAGESLGFNSSAFRWCHE